MEKNACDGQYYTPPPKLGKWEGFSIFMWNSETSQFMGRTAASWGKILLFYVLFYTCLIGFFSAMLTVFYQTLDMKVPKWQLEGSLIGNNPGLGFRPMPPESNVESTLIWYRKAENEENWRYWTNELDKFLEEYPQMGQESYLADNLQDCNFGVPVEPGKVCRVASQGKKCNKNEHYNYHKGTPCIYLKLNKIFNWQPQFYNTSINLPKLMPIDLVNYIATLDKDNATKKGLLNTVWISCEGENPADAENMGPIAYEPTRGFPGYYFPFQNVEGYLSPLVAVHFERPATGVLINIECKAWAHNINHDRHERRGSVHFELMVD